VGAKCAGFQRWGIERGRHGAVSSRWPRSRGPNRVQRTAGASLVLRARYAGPTIGG